METLCSRFYAVISGTSGDINMGSSGECLESKDIKLAATAAHVILTICPILV